MSDRPRIETAATIEEARQRAARGAGRADVKFGPDGEIKSMRVTERARVAVDANLKIDTPARPAAECPKCGSNFVGLKVIKTEHSGDVLEFNCNECGLLLHPKQGEQIVQAFQRQRSESPRIA